jgi:sugar lactone lactonase YvrE
MAENKIASVWMDRDIGAPESAGSHTWIGSTLNISGDGNGPSSKNYDQYHFVYQACTSRNFEIIARLVDFDGKGSATAGIVARQDDSPGGPMAAVYYKAGDQSIDWMCHVPNAVPQASPKLLSGSVGLAQGAPIWLKMVRIGESFAVYKSEDGKFWSIISNFSGGYFAPQGQIKVGFFVSSGNDGVPSVATFDSIKLESAHMPYKTSWVGNTFGSTATDGHVSNNINAMWVSSDGTCYTSSIYDEGGPPITSYRNGKVYRAITLGSPLTREGGITGDDKYVFAAYKDRILRLDPSAPDFAPAGLQLSESLLDDTTKCSVVSGMASNGPLLFVADSKSNIIRVVNADQVERTSAELVGKNFPFLRPGPMIVDERGDLWIIQRGNDFSISTGMAPIYSAAIKCYKTDGTFTGREITDVVNPCALAYDATRDQLLVGENGPDQNLRFYSKLETRPALVRTFGEKGGIYGGLHPGLVYDPEAGSYARFAGIAGVGIDRQGSIYVGGGFQGSDLRMFTPTGKLGWMLNSNTFCDTYDVDPSSDGSEIYGAYNHLHLDLSRSLPGSEQKYIGYNWDLRKFGEPVRGGGSQSIVRRLGPGKSLVMFTSGQGIVGDIDIYRYNGEIAIPAGGLHSRGTILWIDKNGDGKEEPDEDFTMSSGIGYITGLCVDTKGDIWAAVPGTGGCFMRHFLMQGINAKGVPIYSGVKGVGYQDIPFPEEGGHTNGRFMYCRMDYDANRDIMVAMYPVVPRVGPSDASIPQYALARYDNWVKGNRTSKWKIRAFSPQTSPEYFNYEVNVSRYAGYMGMQIAGDYVFMAYLFGQVHVFDLNTGKLVQILSPGPEVNGRCAYEDAAMGLRAYKTKAGEYLIFTENSGWGGKDNLYRWKPGA